jgi:hypothetical protein
MYVKKHIVNVTTAADGSATVYTSEPLNGPILKIIYEKPASGGFATGVDFAITTEDTGQTVWSESNVDTSKSVAPLEKKQTTAGVDATYDGTNAIYGPIYAAFERLKISITNGGNGLAGQFVILEG